MSQSRRHSLLETLCSTALGFALATGAAALWYWHHGYSIPAHQQFELGVILTAVSIARGYLVRRLFNRWCRG